jgi:hypothetical protein
MESEKSTIENNLVSDLDRQILYHFEQTADDKRMFYAKKQDKIDNEFLKKRFSNDHRGTKSIVDEEDGYEDKYYQGEKTWNRNLEPNIVIPKGYNEKL